MKTGFDYLLSFESEIKQKNVFLPKVEEIKEEFVGIGFRIGERTLLIKMDEVNEIVDMPKCTKVGGTKPWFLGLANVRGKLLPISDLHGYMFGGRASIRTSARVLIYQKNGIFIGLKVDDILGLKHFFLDEMSKGSSTENKQIDPYIEEVFSRSGQDWSVFNIQKFATNNDFINVSR